MIGLLRLGLLYASRNRVQTSVVAVSIAVAAALPIAGRVIVERYEHRLESRSTVIPLVVGARGSRFDLVLATVFFRATPIAKIPMRVADELASEDRGVVVPVHAGHTARDAPIVAVGFDYFDQTGLTPQSGTLPARRGDAVLGSSLAARLALGPGDTIRSDRRELYDLSVPPPVVMRIVGVLGPTGSVDDDAVFVDLETAWVLEGLSHAHREAAAVDDADVVFRGDESIAVRPTLETETEFTDDNTYSFHLHADRGTLPLTGVLVFPSSEKNRTIIEASINTAGEYQAVRPTALVDELFEVVFRVRPVFDTISLLLGGATIALVVLTTTLATRLRADEFDVLDRIGAPRGFVIGLVAAQAGVVLFLGGLLAAAAVYAAVALVDLWFGW